MRRSATDARGFIEGLSREDFLIDKRTQHAVVMCLIVIGEASTKMMDQHPKFAARHAEVPWRSMRGMRNRIAHGYFKIDFDVVWDTVETALPELLDHLPEADTSEPVKREQNRDGHD